MEFALKIVEILSDSEKAMTLAKKMLVHIPK